jgi:hypothetical protein
VTEKERQLFVSAWAERLQDVLPSEIRVEQPTPTTLRTRGYGRFAGHSSSTVGGSLRLPLPRRILLQMFFDAELRGLQFQMTYATGADWPAKESKSRVRISDGKVHLEFLDHAGNTIRALRPITCDSE